MTIWTRTFTVVDLDAIGLQTASQHCGIRYTGIALDSRTRNADGTLHPGALGVLAETVGSVAASLCIDTLRRICVGQTLQINHPVPIAQGPIRATASAVAILDDSHVWDIVMRDPADGTVCVAHLTMAILDRT
jgi:1,4-dihydroxy-2-naphthoyl-CoA hydrolase